jgi:hypothetical protein
VTYAICGVVFLVIGAMFFWFNNNSPLQTPIPAFALPVGAVLLIIGLTKVLP